MTCIPCAAGSLGRKQEQNRSLGGSVRAYSHAAARSSQRPHAQANGYEAEGVVVLAGLREQRRADEQAHLGRRPWLNLETVFGVRHWVFSYPSAHVCLGTTMLDVPPALVDSKKPEYMACPIR